MKMKAIIVLMLLLIVPFASAAQIQVSVYPSSSSFRVINAPAVVRIGNTTAVTTSGARMISAATEKPAVLPPQFNAQPAYAKKSVLICPHAIKSYFTKVIPPYSTHGNDCSMAGKSGYVKEYVNALEHQAKQCGLTKLYDWKNVLETRKDLDVQVEALEEKRVCKPGEGIEAIMNTRKLFDSSVSYFDEQQTTANDKYYSKWLESIATDTDNYCQMMDELVAPLAEGCAKINSKCTSDGGVSGKQRQEYHKIISESMDNATTAYKYTDAFYIKLQASIESFRKEYNESKLECGSPAGQMQITVFEPTVSQPKQNIFKRFFSWLFGKE
jgi:hypothetical protein